MDFFARSNLSLPHAEARLNIKSEIFCDTFEVVESWDIKKIIDFSFIAM